MEISSFGFGQTDAESMQESGVLRKGGNGDSGSG